jgi:hypothetical protein
VDLQIWQSCGCILLPLTRCPWRMLGGVSHVADMRPAHVPYHMGPGPTSVVGCTCMMTWDVYIAAPYNCCCNSTP